MGVGACWAMNTCRLPASCNGGANGGVADLSGCARTRAVRLGDSASLISQRVCVWARSPVGEGLLELCLWSAVWAGAIMRVDRQGGRASGSERVVVGQTHATENSNGKPSSIIYRAVESIKI